MIVLTNCDQISADLQLPLAHHSIHFTMKRSMGLLWLEHLARISSWWRQWRYWTIGSGRLVWPTGPVSLSSCYFFTSSKAKERQYTTGCPPSFEFAQVWSSLPLPLSWLSAIFLLRKLVSFWILLWQFLVVRGDCIFRSDLQLTLSWKVSLVWWSSTATSNRHLLVQNE